MNRTKIAAVMFWIGALTVAGAVLQGMLLTYPLTVGVAILLMVPYVYIHGKRGFTNPTTSPEGG